MRTPRQRIKAAMRCVSLAICMLASAPLRAQVSEPGPRADDAFDVMNLLSQHELHVLRHERWNAYGQATYISSWKRPFGAKYTNLQGSTNSLVTSRERSFTGTATLYLGVALWPGAEAYLVPEVVAERALSHLAGLGGAIQNFELQKSGSETPLAYLSRAYVTQTLGFGGAPIEKSSDPLQLGTVVDTRRLVVILGNFSVLDFFDKNVFAGDLRRQFFNMAFLTHAAYDFAADARGYAWGGIIEYYHDAWSIRAGRITPPKSPNQLALDFRLLEHYGDQVEVARTHALAGQAGAVRLLVYRNHETMGRFADALAAYRSDHAKSATRCPGFNYGSNNPTAPDLCWVRKPNVKMGVGINVEQHLADDVGVFLRAMVSDGETEVYSFTSADRSLSLGILARGSAWHRPLDSLGVGYGQAWISRDHAAYLAAGGIDGFIGDGQLAQGSERVFEVFYSVNIAGPLWLSGDYQHISNPAYNTDRGPVDIFGARGHAEF